MSTVSALLIHHINQKSGGKLIELYVEMDQLAVKFGRTTDSHYIERLNKGIESSNALTEIRLIAENNRERRVSTQEPPSNTTGLPKLLR